MCLECLRKREPIARFVILGLAILGLGSIGRSQGPTTPSSYDQISPVLLGQQSFAAMKAKDVAEKPDVMARQKQVLAERYNLEPRVDKSVTMSRGKPIPVGPTVKLSAGMTW